MKRVKWLWLILSLCFILFMLGITSSGFAAGRAMAILLIDEETTQYILVKFDSGQFTQAEAERLTQLLVGATNQIPDGLPEEVEDVDHIILTPDIMTSMDLGDADLVRQLLQDMGIPHVFIDLTKKPAPVAGVTNFNFDIYYYSEFLSSDGMPQSLYIVTLGVPEYWLEMASEL